MQIGFYSFTPYEPYCDKCGYGETFLEVRGRIDEKPQTEIQKALSLLGDVSTETSHDLTITIRRKNENYIW